MRPRIVLALAVLWLTGCAEAPRPWKEVLPATVEGNWVRGEVTEVAAGQAPAVVRSLGLRGTARTAYRGAGDMEVIAYRMAPGTPFEARQKWRPEAGTMFFGYQDYFIVVRSAAGREVLDRFTGALEKAMR